MAMQKSKIEMKRINMNIPVSLYDKVTEYADYLGINTTSAFIVLLNQALNNNSILELMPTIFSVMNDIKSGNIDQKTFDDLNMLADKKINIDIDPDNIL